MFRLPSFIPSDERIAEIAALMVEPVGAQLDNRPSRSGTPILASSSITTSPSVRPPAWSAKTTPMRWSTSAAPGSTWTACTAGARPTTRSWGQQAARRPPRRRGRPAPQHAGDRAHRRPANDENIFVSQLQLTMLKFHNKVVDLVSGVLSAQRTQLAAVPSVGDERRVHHAGPHRLHRTRSGPDRRTLSPQPRAGARRRPPCPRRFLRLRFIGSACRRRPG